MCGQRRKNDNATTLSLSASSSPTIKNAQALVPPPFQPSLGQTCERTARGERKCGLVLVLTAVGADVTAGAIDQDGGCVLRAGGRDVGAMGGNKVNLDPL
jgi:hypothetical protein